MSTDSYSEEIKKYNEIWELDKKQRIEIRRTTLNNQFQEYSKNQPVKCLSDKGLLYLKFGIDKLKNSPDKDLSIRNENYIEKSLEDFCIEFYNNNIRGNMEFTNKSMITIASSVLYICCVMGGVMITQADIAEIYGISDSSIRKGYKHIREVCNI